jgi:lipopolysaccharide/colanic/teichoic acid biosynthesis glycosyltransferase
MESKLDMMPPSKRVFDLAIALLLAVPLSLVIALIGISILITDGRPVFYLSERMKTPLQGFTLVKFRTMRPDAGDGGVTGGDKTSRITRLGGFLRRSRLDELPQLWNILKGDMSFVGPRPPLRRYVEGFPDIYGAVLLSRPGLTGLATLYFHRHEQRLLAACTSANETEALYRRVCIPRKAQLDLLYQAHRSLCLDIWLMIRTVLRVIWKRR